MPTECMIWNHDMHIDLRLELLAWFGVLIGGTRSLAGRVRVILGSEVLQLEVARTRHLISPDDGDYDESTGGVERCGRLMKKTPTAGHWVHRWLVLRTDGCLYYYKTPSLVS